MNPIYLIYSVDKIDRIGIQSIKLRNIKFLL